MSEFFGELSLWVLIAVFIGATAVIAIFGSRLARYADRLADLTGMGEAIAGALLLGASTSMPGILTSGISAFNGFPQLAYSNALGGVAAQTAFLAIADMAYREANLEHAAASVGNLLQCALLITLLSIALVAVGGPEFAIFGVHPASIVLFIVYILGMKSIASVGPKATWQPEQTKETKEDVPEEGPAGESAGKVWFGFFISAIIVGAAGWVVAESAMVITDKTPLSGSAVGGVFTAIATSLPELVTAIAAVRQGALTLAVGDIIGGNTFDMLFLAVADFAYRPGSIYHVVGEVQVFQVGIVILLNSILIMGLLRREKRGFANIGFESGLILLIYGLSVFWLFAS